MHIILLKYVQLFCITVFFTNNVNCDELFVENSNDEIQLHQLAACTMDCVNSKQLPFKTCYKDCYDTKEYFPTKETYRKGHIDLLCRDSTSLSLHVKMVDNKTTNQEANAPRKMLTTADEAEFMRRRRRRAAEAVHGKSTSLDERMIYLIKIEELGGQYVKKRIVYMANESFVTIENLTPNQAYNISATVYNARNEFINLHSNKAFRTQDIGVTPAKITNMWLERLTTSDDNLLNAEISWKPGADLACYYDIIYYSPTFIEAVYHYIRKPEQLYRSTLTDLMFEKNFTIHIMARNKKEPSRASPVTYFNLETPKCLDWFSSLDHCAPNQLSNPVVVHQPIGNRHTLQINITWDQPVLQPLYYEIGLYDLFVSNLSESGNSLIFNVSGDTNEVFVPEFQVWGVQYEVMIRAISLGGKSRTTLLVDVVHSDIKLLNWKPSFWAIIVLIPLISLILVAIMMFMIINRRAKIKRYKSRIEYFKELEQKAPNDPKTYFDYKLNCLEQVLQNDYEWKLISEDVMEVRQDQINVLETIGEGAFGLVKKGILRINDSKSRVVAIKMLKSYPRIEDIKMFFREIEVMKSVAEHPNIVSIVGHSTADLSTLMLLTEYCSHGNLLSFLKAQFERLLRHHDNLKTQSNHSPSALIADKSPEHMFNFDTSLIEKDMTSYKTLCREDQSTTDNDSPKSRPNLIVNRMYDDFNIPVSKPTWICTNACKCQVDITNNNNNDTDAVSADDADMVYKNIRNKTRLKISDCGCQPPQGKAVDNPKGGCNLHQGKCDCLQPLTVVNKGYGMFFDENPSDNEVLDSKDLLSFAKQIASGMEYLALNKIVHRDLAARNILVCADKVVKIADFGLSRDIYQENIYKKTGNGKLPIKWLALESMTHQVYTSQSDVWSYGILLYEIVTLGGSPYPMVPTNALLKHLKSGKRMERPENCSPELYSLMFSCWFENPLERPIFSNICRKLDEMLQKEEGNKYIDLNEMLQNRSIRFKAEYDSYLKPI